MKTQGTQKWLMIDRDGDVALYRNINEPGLFQARLRNCERFVRRNFRALDVTTALSKVPAVLEIEPVPQRPEAFTIDLIDAFTQTLDHTGRRQRSRKDWLYAVERFMVWLSENHPAVTHWALLTRQHLREYLDTFEGRAANTKRLAMQPLTQTAGYMSREFGFPNIAERLRIGSKLRTTPKAVYLTDVVAFCDWVRANKPRFEVGVALQGLAGLQLQEVLRLTWNQVDLNRGLIEISGEVKNEYRNRVIPVPESVLQALKRAKAWQDTIKSQVRPIREYVVCGPHGEQFEDYSSYSRRIREALKAWNPNIDWTPKDLRNCLPTFGLSEGIWNAVWEQYIGHAPRTVTTRHYVPRLGSVSGGEEEALQGQMDLFRLQVTKPVERAVLGIRAKRAKSAKSADVQLLYSSEA